jgi:hypothetical protein
MWPFHRRLTGFRRIPRYSAPLGESAVPVSRPHSLLGTAVRSRSAQRPGPYGAQNSTFTLFERAARENSSGPRPPSPSRGGCPATAEAGPRTRVPDRHRTTAPDFRCDPLGRPPSLRTRGAPAPAPPAAFSTGRFKRLIGALLRLRRPPGRFAPSGVRLKTTRGERRDDGEHHGRQYELRDQGQPRSGRDHSRRSARHRPDAAERAWSS